MTVYIKAEDSVCIHNPDVKIKDVASIYCTDKDMEQKVKEAKLFHFKKRGNEREFISILKAVEVIKEIDKGEEVGSLLKDCWCMPGRLFWSQFLNHEL